MAIHHAVLSLLSRGESYGYELKLAFDRSVGPQWGALNIGHVYQVLERLRRDELVEVVRSEPQPRRTDRQIYAITDAGREELDRWLRTPGVPGSGYRDDLYLKLVCAAAGGREALDAVIGSERMALLAELHALRGLERADALVDLLVDGAALQVEARLALLDRAERSAGTLAEAAEAPRRATRLRRTA